MLSDDPTTVSVVSADPGLVGRFAARLASAEKLRYAASDTGSRIALVDDRLPDAAAAVQCESPDPGALSDRPRPAMPL